MNESWETAMQRLRDTAATVLVCLLVLLLFAAHFHRQLKAKDEQLAEWQAGAHGIAGEFGECVAGLHTAVQWHKWNEEAWR